MTPQEKATELVKKYKDYSLHHNSLEKCIENAKQCALIAVEEIIKNNCGSSMSESDIAYKNEIYCDEYFWQDVEAEIKKL